MAKSRKASSRVRKLRTAPTVRQVIETKSIAKSESKKKIKLPKPIAKTNFSNWPVLKQLIAVARLITPRYFVNAWRELRQVTWTSGRDTRRLTLAVFIFATVFGLVIAVVDKGLDEFFKKVVLR